MTGSSSHKVDTVSAPFTTWNLLFTLALAASGETSRQLLSALGLSDEKENTLIKANKDLNKNVVQTGNAGVSYTGGTYMYWDTELQVNPEFRAILNYGLEIVNEALDFSDSAAAAATANSVIVSPYENLLEKEDFAKSRMILVSSTIFEGLWSKPFNTLDTTIEPFYSEKGEIVRQVYMMNQRNRFPFSNIKELGAFVLELPYGLNDKYCLLILLPSPETTVSEVYRNLVHSFTLKDILYKLNNDTKYYGLEEINIKIPRFQIVSVMIMVSEMAAQFPVNIFLIFGLSAIRVNGDVQLHDSCRQFSTELINATAFKLYKSNVAVSPYSIWSAMFSVALAANSTTAKEVYKVLRLPKKAIIL
ncbi:Serine protease inhibitor 77Ba [Eumeta japonica]|uniref:Serine protease inhibitor 77Ba n=1 Tax=Eumeta variegata TaxID=151549 RepID=A0A4C1Z545_EUMVA|nr:Serine protease inhibitor 77Ba [Eumeta japonica]